MKHCQREGESNYCVYDLLVFSHVDQYVTVMSCWLTYWLTVQQYIVLLYSTLCGVPCYIRSQNTHNIKDHAVELKFCCTQYCWELLTVDSDACDLGCVNARQHRNTEALVRICLCKSGFRESFPISGNIRWWTISTARIPEVDGRSFAVIAEILKVDLAAACHSSLARDIVLKCGQALGWPWCTLCHYGIYIIWFDVEYNMSWKTDWRSTRFSQSTYQRRGAGRHRAGWLWKRSTLMVSPWCRIDWYRAIFQFNYFNFNKVSNFFT